LDEAEEEEEFALELSSWEVKGRRDKGDGAVLMARVKKTELLAGFVVEGKTAWQHLEVSMCLATLVKGG
jgi:hypothetical protein